MCGIVGYFQFRGEVNGDLPRFVRTARDRLTHRGPDAGGVSITLLESMSHELPVVVMRVGGNSEVVVDGQTGYLVPPRDSRALAKAIVTFLEDRDLAGKAEGT